VLEKVSLPVSGGPASIRELTGEDERLVQGADTRSAVGLLERVVEGVAVRSLTAADRDRLLARIQGLTYGNRITSSAHCPGCGNLFDLSFELSALVAQVDSQREPLAMPQDDGTFRTTRGSHFRLPDSEMELAARGPRELMASCLMSRAAGDTDEDIEAAMEAVAPLIDVDLDAGCPECGKHQQVRFNIQSYLLEALLRERRTLFFEIHSLASAYGWTLTELFSLRRSERRLLVELVETETRRRTGAFA
jgi:hypothetical protein